MSGNEMPPMPDPASRPEPSAQEEEAIRLEPGLVPVVERGDDKTDEAIQGQNREPKFSKEQVPGYPTNLKPEKLVEEDPSPDTSAQRVEPITSEALWKQDIMASENGTSALSKKLLPFLALLGVAIIGATAWWITSSKQSADSTVNTATPSARVPLQLLEPPSWEPEARATLTSYLNAEQQRDLDGTLSHVTSSRETQALLPIYKIDFNPDDVVQVSEFVAKPLPKSFTDHGIYLMYYQRPNTLPDDALFRPLVPIRVKLALDSPSFLEISAKSGYLKTRNRQNICAFFKRGNDNRVTLDWPVFVQTRYRHLSKFTSRPRIDAKSVFRLMVHKVQPTLINNVYRKHLKDHDWYRVYCPGYVDETHIVAVPKKSNTSKILLQRFAAESQDANHLHAITAELGWLASKKDGRPVLTLSNVVCWEFYNLNLPEKSK